MAKYETEVTGTINDISEYISRYESELGLSAEVVDAATGSIGDVTYMTATYERYAYLGGNRSSLSITMLQHGNKVRIIAISAAGSTGVIIKINHWSEDAFLQAFVELIERYKKENEAR
ncbi:MAG: DUF6054 family protein [Bacillota bacterium]|nr:DUF6054 family protein [Bacillota bacterium]